MVLYTVGIVDGGTSLVQFSTSYIITCVFSFKPIKLYQKIGKLIILYRLRFPVELIDLNYTTITINVKLTFIKIKICCFL